MRKLPLPPFFVKSDNLVFHHKPCFSESQNTAGLQSGSTPPLFCWITPDMMLIFGLMLLLETAASVEFNCSFDQSGPCNAALGDELRLKLADASKNDLKIQKRIYNTQNDPVCRIKNDRINEKECDLFKNRPVSVSNGILVINSVIRADSGIYSLQVFNSGGTEIFNADLQVIVEGNDPATIAIVLGCLAVVLILLVIVAYYFYKKKNQLKPTRYHVNEHDAQKREEEQKRPDVEYATVSSQNKMKMKEEEIHYGEVTFMSSSVQQPRQTHDDCVYSEVHTR